MPGPERSLLLEERVDSTSSRHPWLSLIGVAGLFVVIMMAAALQGRPQITAPQDRRENFVIAPVTPEPVDETPLPMPVDPVDDSSSLIVNVILSVLLGAAVLVLLFFGIRFLVRLLTEAWRNRPLVYRDGSELSGVGAAEPAAAGEPAPALIRRGIAQALHTIDAHGDPADSIVAAWVGLEETASDAGTARALHETPAEFTVRIVGRRAGIAAETTSLLDLYERVRFGGYRADENDRAQAQRYLRLIEAGWR